MGRKVVKVFLDSNVILSGLLSERGAPRIILDLLELKLPFVFGTQGGSTGRYNLIEIERNLKKKMPSLFFLYKSYLPKLNLRIIPLPKPEEVRGFSGQMAEKDIPVFLSAIRSKADFLVTGDKQHFGKMKGLEKYPLHVVTPSEFIDSILPEILKGLEEKDK
jgi:predicted nucleic acid-binding protein